MSTSALQQADGDKCRCHWFQIFDKDGVGVGGWGQMMECHYSGVSHKVVTLVSSLSTEIY